MAVSINQIQRPQENKESDLDKLAKLISIGASGYGVYDSIKQAPQREAIAKAAQLDVEQKTAADAMRRRWESGNITEADVLANNKEYIFTDDPNKYKGARQINVERAAGTFDPSEPVSPMKKWVISRADHDSALSEMIKNAELKKINAETNKLYADANSPKKQFDYLPKEAQIGIEKVAGRQAVQLSIANSIDSTIKILDSKDVPYDQKLMQARQLIKTLNSQEGQDAVGSEEAKRLAGMIEFRFFNFTEPGAMFGRDLDGFSSQAKITANSLRDSAKSNADLINNYRTGTPVNDQRYAVQPKLQTGKGKVNGADVFNVPTANAAQPHPQDSQAVQWAKQNPQDPRAAQILQANGVK